MSRFKWQGQSYVWLGRDFSRLVFFGWALVGVGLVAAYLAFVMGLAWLLTLVGDHQKDWPMLVPFFVSFAVTTLVLYLWPRKDGSA